MTKFKLILLKTYSGIFITPLNIPIKEIKIDIPKKQTISDKLIKTSLISDIPYFLNIKCLPTKTRGIIRHRHQSQAR